MSPVSHDSLSSKSIQSYLLDQTVGVGYMPDEQYIISGKSIDNPFELFQPLPAYSTVLGICQDGLPLVLDLTDPSPGAILVSGERQTGKTRLLRSILISACITNNVDQLYFYLVTPEPGNHADLQRLEHCYGVFSSYDKAACELVVELSALVEQRKCGRHLGLKCVLVIENLYEFNKHQDFEVLNHLKWLFRYGANNGIWLISSIESERSNLIGPDLLKEQKTKILSDRNGWTMPDIASVGQPQKHMHSYRTLVGNEWVEFWLPSPNDRVMVR